MTTLSLFGQLLHNFEHAPSRDGESILGNFGFALSAVWMASYGHDDFQVLKCLHVQAPQVQGRLECLNATLQLELKITTVGVVLVWHPFIHTRGF